MNYRVNSEEDNRFKTISDFKDCLIRGGEVEFQWKNNTYSIGGYDKYAICMDNQEETEKICDTPDEVLDYMVGEDILRDVITDVTVTWRTI